jgi:pimeloyl-ACP methyl ester carboxylesterase
MLAQFKANGNTDMVRKLEAAPVTLTNGTPEAYRAVRDEAMHSLGIGTTHDMHSILSGIVLPSWQSRDYTLGEKATTWRAKAAAGVSIVWDTVLATDLTKQVAELKIPVYFFSGRYDYTVNYTLAKDYFEKIKAPVKGFYTFEQSAHSPILATVSASAPGSPEPQRTDPALWSRAYGPNAQTRQSPCGVPGGAARTPASARPAR